MPKIISYKSIGKRQTYDIEVAHKDHQFYLESGALTSNSHAVSYALNSYMCAYLLYYYQPEWLCAYMESMIVNPDKRGKALSEIKAFGYKIGKVDINLSEYNWTIGPNKTFIPSFLSVNGVGAAAIEEITKNRPYKTIDDLLWDPDGKWRHSKFNKRVFEHLIMIGAFDSMDIVGPGKTFDNYRQMHEVIIANYDQLKKKKGKEVFAKLLTDTAGMEDWSNIEKVKMHQELVGDINVDLLISTDTQEKLANKGISPVDDFQDTAGIVWFVLLKTIKKVTRTGKDYLVLEVMGPSGKMMKINCWNADKDTQLEPNRPYLAEVNKNDFGISCRIQKLKKIG